MQIHKVEVHEEGPKSILVTAPANLSGKPFTVKAGAPRDFFITYPVR